VGYILPINPIQSGQYANRLNMKPYNFARIGRVQLVKLKSDFLEEFEESLAARDQKQEEKDEEKPSQSRSPLSNFGNIYPNPANLSPAISKVVGKGININTYI